MPIDLGPEDLQRLRAQDDGRPFVLAQLLKFVPGGREQFIDYSQKAQRLLRTSGATVVYAGECRDRLGASEPNGWDVIVLARYPSRTAYVELMSSAAFQEISEQRRKSLREAVFFVMDDWPGR